MIIVGRPINGISINGLEYLLDENNKNLEFENEKAAKDYLILHEVKEEYLDDFHYIEV